ncbi:MAG: hypothetical protein ABSB87_08520 [Terriglobales bacterium]|jgi:hypothetical protein
MSNILLDKAWQICRKLACARALLAVIPLLQPAQIAAQTPPPVPAMVARFSPGESIRYEFEGVVQMVAGHARDVTVNVPDDCSYRLRAVLKFDFDRASAEGALSGRVHFKAVRYDSKGCAFPKQADLAKSLQNLEANGATFELNPAGDTRLSNSPVNAECEGVSVLLKAAWDLLQQRLSDHAIAPSPASIPTHRFLYWPDTFVEGMDVTSSSMQYRRDATIAAEPYAWLQYKQIFSPSEMPAYVEPRSRARDFTGTTFVTGKSNVSLLFDRAAGRIVYLRRQRSIDNRLMLKYEPSQTQIPVATYSIEEESTLRWLPEKNSEAWLAELHKFEDEPAAEVNPIPSSGPTSTGSTTGSTTTGAPSGSPIADLARASRQNKPHNETHEATDLTDLLNPAPRGFERWQRSYCRGSYCFDLSIAVPEQTKIADRTDTTVLLLSGSGERTITVAVGPVLDPRRASLTDDELLQQQAARFVANYLWFAASSGTKLNFEDVTVHDRPAAFSDFTSTARDLTPIRGRLVMVIGPYDRLTPVTCSYAAAQQDALDAVCQTVAGSIVIH